jgi:hypothetical protein
MLDISTGPVLCVLGLMLFSQSTILKVISLSPSVLSTFSLFSSNWCYNLKKRGNKCICFYIHNPGAQSYCRLVVQSLLWLQSSGLRSVGGHVSAMIHFQLFPGHSHFFLLFASFLPIPLVGVVHIFEDPGGPPSPQSPYPTPLSWTHFE